MQPEDTIHVEAYPELESEEEEILSSEDEKPVVTNFNDWTISVLRDRLTRGKVDLQPKYQREFVWSTKPELRSRPSSLFC